MRNAGVWSEGVVRAARGEPDVSAVPTPVPGQGDLRFHRGMVTAMALVLVAGFVLQLAMGRSSFGAPPVVHLHALVFMGWVAIVVAQAWLAAGGQPRLHRALGGLALAWLLAMLVVGPLVTIAAVRTGRVPFFFQPQYLLLADPAILFGAAGLVIAAVGLRHDRAWHPRLQIGAFMMLMGPGIGRIIPMPLLGPHAFEIASVIPVIFALVGMARDKRVHGKAHPAWAWSIGVLAVVLIAVRLVAYSPVGDAVHAAAVAGSPAAGSDGRAYPPPPPL